RAVRPTCLSSLDTSALRLDARLGFSEIRTVNRSFFAFIIGAGAACSARAQDLSDYSPPEKAATVAVRNLAADRAGLAGYLGVNVATQAGTLTVAAVAPDSPAAKAGLQVGDVVAK